MRKALSVFLILDSDSDICFPRREQKTRRTRIFRARPNTTAGHRRVQTKQINRGWSARIKVIFAWINPQRPDTRNILHNLTMI
jgi:hypothetical protein